MLTPCGIQDPCYSVLFLHDTSERLEPGEGALANGDASCAGADVTLGSRLLEWLDRRNIVLDVTHKAALLQIAYACEALTRCPFRKSCASTFWRRQRIELGHCRIMFGHFSLVIRSSTMPVPLAPPVTLGCDEQSHLASIVRAHSTPHALVFRCRLILRPAAPDRPSNLQVP